MYINQLCLSVQILQKRSYYICACELRIFNRAFNEVSIYEVFICMPFQSFTNRKSGDGRPKMPFDQQVHNEQVNEKLKWKFVKCI